MLTGFLPSWSLEGSKFSLVGHKVTKLTLNETSRSAVKRGTLLNKPFGMLTSQNSIAMTSGQTIQTKSDSQLWSLFSSPVLDSFLLHLCLVVHLILIYLPGKVCGGFVPRKGPRLNGRLALVVDRDLPNEVTVTHFAAAACQ